LTIAANLSEQAIFSRQIRCPNASIADFTFR
jgi:hypothetical protein